MVPVVAVALLVVALACMVHGIARLEIAKLASGVSAMHAALRERAWLRRVVHLQLDNRFFVIEYNGRGFGYESVHVNGRLAARAVQLLRPHLVCPRIEFVLGDVAAVIEVRVWPWLAMRTFRLLVAGQAVFEDTGLELCNASEEWGNAQAVGHEEAETGIRVAGQMAVKPHSPTME